MGILKLSYNNGQNELNWPEVDQITVSASAELVATTTDNTEIVLRQFDSTEEAFAARESLLSMVPDKLEQAAGNGDITVIIDDL